MILANIILMEANVNNNGVIITESACKSLVEKYKQTPEKIEVKLDNVPAALGHVIDMFYDEEKKHLIGVMELRIDFASGGKILKSFETPEGNRVIDCTVTGIVAKISPIKIIKKETKVIEGK